MVRSSVFGFLILLLSATAVNAQTSTCAQTLRLARSTYEQGRFHEIPALLENCLKGGEGNFTKQESVEALRILTLAYLYQEEPEQADQAMLRLLNTDHFFEINANVDPAEFVALYRTFRTTPLFSIGLRAGVNSTLAAPKKNYYVGGTAANSGEYSQGINFQVGAVFEKQLFTGKRKDSPWTAAPEIMFTNHSYGYANESLTISDQTGQPYSFIDGFFDQSRLDLNALAQYKLKNSIINPYLTFGVAASLLVKGEFQVETQFPEEGSVVTGTPVDMKKTFNPLDYALIAGAGVKYKFGDIYLVADVRYKYGLTNLVKTSARSNPEATFDYGFVSNDLTQSSLMVNIGFVWPYFNPKKLLK
ncbi:MAG: porin family protein [Cyclobacteriaceae bacterium]